MKYCRKCQTLKRKADFNKRSQSKDGLQHHCRECYKAHTAHRSASGAGRKDTWRYRGIDVEAAQAAVDAHNGRCDCCGTTDPGTRQGWSLDHCHATGAIRGLLCRACNTGIGKLGDNLAGILRALRYLQRNR